MKRFILGLILLCSAILFIPAATLSLFDGWGNETLLPVSVMPADAESGDAITMAVMPEDYTVTVYLVSTGETVTMDFEEYIAGVLGEEMPPGFLSESLKAQAVAARSYILSKIAGYMESGIPKNHHGALLCTDYTHCRTWRPLEESKQEWELKTADDHMEKIQKAVQDTRGEYLVYDNKVAKAYFHKINSGRTEDIEDVWGVSLPYLQSVDSPGDRRADGYRSRVFYPKEAFFTVLRGLRPKLQLPENLEDGAISAKHHEGGSVEAVELFGESFSGKEIKEAFGLRSMAFSLQFQEGKAVFDVKGYGHGVGMSQFGANKMAEEDKGYQEILQHYYKGVQLACLYQKA